MTDDCVMIEPLRKLPIGNLHHATKLHEIECFYQYHRWFSTAIVVLILAMILNPTAINALHRCFTKLLTQIFVNLSASYHRHRLLDYLPLCYGHSHFQLSFICHFPISSTTTSFLVVFPQPYHSHQLC